MTSKQKRSLSKWPMYLLNSAAAISLALVTYSASALVNTPKISHIQAQKLIENSKDSKFPLEINDEVLKQLNYYVGTINGQNTIKASLKLKDGYSKTLNQKLDEYQIPKEILAVAMMESGFKNVHSKHGARAAGIWQFIPSTARAYGLVVNKTIDQRMDIKMETDAAMRYLKSLNLRFKNWHLAILGYNAGETKIQRGINKTGSRDPWVLIKNGYQGDKNYLAKIIAGVIILKNPSLIN